MWSWLCWLEPVSHQCALLFELGVCSRSVVALFTSALERLKPLLLGCWIIDKDDFDWFSKPVFIVG